MIYEERRYNQAGILQEQWTRIIYPGLPDYPKIQRLFQSADTTVFSSINKVRLYYSDNSFVEYNEKENS